MTLCEEYLNEFKDALNNKESYISDIMSGISQFFKLDINRYSEIYIDIHYNVLSKRIYFVHTNLYYKTLDKSTINIRLKLKSFFGFDNFLSDFDKKECFNNLCIQNDSDFNDKFTNNFIDNITKIIDAYINNKDFGSTSKDTGFLIRNTFFLLITTPNVFNVENIRYLKNPSYNYIFSRVINETVDNIGDDIVLLDYKLLNKLTYVSKDKKLELERLFLMNTNTDLNKLLSLNEKELSDFINNNLDNLIKAFTSNAKIHNGLNQYKLLSQLYKINKIAVNNFIKHLDLYIDDISKISSLQDSGFIKDLLNNSKSIYIYDITKFFRVQIKNKSILFSNVIITLLNDLNIDDKIFIDYRNCDSVINIFESLSLIDSLYDNEFKRLIRFIKNHDKVDCSDFIVVNDKSFLIFK